MNFVNINSPVAKLYMVGAAYAKRLKKLEIETIEDLLHHYPYRWEDWRQVAKIGSLQAGEKVTIQGRVIECKNIYTKFRKRIQKAKIQDETGTIEVTWFNQFYIPRQLKPGTLVSLSGKIEAFGNKKMLTSPEYEIVKRNIPGFPQERTPGVRICVHTGRLVPVYPETYGLSSKWLRSRLAPLMEKLVPYIHDWLPTQIKKDDNLIDLNSALQKIHFPESKEDLKLAKKRLSFDELFLLQLNSQIRKHQWQKKQLAKALHVDQEKVLSFIDSLPFRLTKAQNKCLAQILDDLSKNKPMNRLLEGDVGSGKTVVAAVAMFVSYLNGLQSALMAPTEILAQQHYKTIISLLKPFGVKVSLLTGSTKKSDLEAEAKTDVYVGTHALLFKKVKFSQLGLTVIDEQHRFGVEQRAALIEKAKSPHLLTMTATPIPRTVALTLYGDLDLSVLDEMPKGRQLVKTWVVPYEKRAAAYQWIERQIKETKSQAFVVCPLIEISQKESMKDIRAATEEFEKLSHVFLPKLKLGLLHGRMKATAKEKILKQFRDKKINLLVSTPVVEVGIDIPNATIMMIEGSDRFGLAQLHQLRGRVGRSQKQSYCLLFSDQKQAIYFKRLKAMEKYHSGFKLAEIDLGLRGPGELYGVKQHGWPELKLASFSDKELIEKTNTIAQAIVAQSPNLSQFPSLKEKIERYKIALVKPN